MQSAVLEFDEAVQVPWRPPLAVVTGTGRVPHLRPASTVARPAVSQSVTSGVSGSAGRRRPVPAAAAPAPAAATPRTVRRPAERRPAERRPVVRRPPAHRSVRLTRRGRRLVIVLSLAVGLALGAMLNTWVAAAGQGSLRLAGESSVVVRQGDSLWSIATAVAGTDDVRTVVDRIQQLNHLHGTALRPGQVLQLP